MASPTLGALLALTSSNWDAVNHQVFGTFTSSGSSGLLVMVCSATATYAQGAVPFVTGGSPIVTSAGLTFTRRSSDNWDDGYDNQYTEIWTAPFNSSLSQRVNVNFTSGNWNNGAFTFYEINDLYSNTDPFDGNGAEPSITHVNTLTQTYTTSQPDDLLIYAVCGVDIITAPIDQAGWSGPSHNQDTAGAGYAVVDLYHKSVSTTQHAVTVSSTNRGIGFVDAYTADAKGVFLQTFVTCVCT